MVGLSNSRNGAHSEPLSLNSCSPKGSCTASLSASCDPCMWMTWPGCQRGVQHEQCPENIAPQWNWSDDWLKTMQVSVGTGYPKDIEDPPPRRRLQPLVKGSQRGTRPCILPEWLSISLPSIDITRAVPWTHALLHHWRGYHLSKENQYYEIGHSTIQPVDSIRWCTLVEYIKWRAWS